MCRHFIEGIVGYGEMEWLRRCRQAYESSKEEHDTNNKSKQMRPNEPIWVKL
ncbi:hypothetical protein JCM15124A_07270 [Prevotella falsenii]